MYPFPVIHLLNLRHAEFYCVGEGGRVIFMLLYLMLFFEFRAKFLPNKQNLEEYFHRQHLQREYFHKAY